MIWKLNATRSSNASPFLLLVSADKRVDSYEMLLRSKRAFYDQFVQELLNKEYRGVCNLLKDTHETAVDFYAESMDRNIEHIDRMAAGLEKT